MKLNTCDTQRQQLELDELRNTLDYVTVMNKCCHGGGGGEDERVYVSYWQFKATNEQQVDLEKGTLVHVINKNNSGWWYVSRIDNDTEGWCPSDYLITSDTATATELMSDPSYDTVSDTGDSTGSYVTDDDSDALPVNGATNGHRKLGDNVFFYKAIKDYLGEVNFKRGDILRVLETSSDAWWTVKHNGCIGKVPAVYLKRLKPSKSESKFFTDKSSHARPPKPKRTYSSLTGGHSPALLVNNSSNHDSCSVSSSSYSQTSANDCDALPDLPERDISSAHSSIVDLEETSVTKVINLKALATYRHDASDDTMKSALSFDRDAMAVLIETGGNSGWWYVRMVRADGANTGPGGSELFGWTPSKYWKVIKKDTDDRTPPPVINRLAYECEPWFVGRMSRSECEALLRNHERVASGDNPTKGCAFMVRQSPRDQEGDYVLSIIDSNECKHFTIKSTVEGHFKVASLSFDDLNQVVVYYKHNTLFVVKATTADKSATKKKLGKCWKA